MKQILLFLFVTGLSAISFAQNWQWAKQGVGTDDDYGNGIATDLNANVYVTGYFFSPTLTFGAYTLTNTGASNTYDVLVAKYDSAGNVLWVRKAGGTSDDNGMAITTDASGNVYVTGYFSGTATFGTVNLTSSGNWDVFTVKYDANGSVLWARKGGGASSDYPNRIATDLNGNVYITGDFWSSSITFGTTTLTTAGGVDLFVVKYDPNGNLLWAKKEGGTAGDSGKGVTTDLGGNVYVSGNFSSASITFGASTLTNAGSADIFAVKYDASGNVLWAKQAGGTGSDYGRDIAASPNGNLYVTGYFNNTATFGTINLTSSGTWSDIFLASYDANGNVLWANRAGGTNIDYGFSIAADANSNVYVTGIFADTATFGSISLISTNVIDWDVFAAKYAPSGNALWALNAGGTANDFGNDIATDPAGSVYVTGYSCCAPATFGSVTLTNATGEEEIFVAKISSPLLLPPTAIFTASASIICEGQCINFTDNSTGNPTGWNWNFSGGNPASSVSQNPSNICYGTAGTYTVTLIASNGNGSDTATTVITVNPPPVAIITGNNTICQGQNTVLTASGGGNYSWNTGQTTSSITAAATATATYSVIVTNAGNCSDTASVTVTVLTGPSANAGTDVTVIYGSNATLTASGGGTYSWSPATGLSCTTCSNPIATHPFGGQGGFTYTVIVTDANGCTNADVVTVYVDFNCGEVFVPNIFSPNNDGQNDLQCVLGNCIKTVSFAIYDRWGEKVFEYNGAPLPSGGVGPIGLLWRGGPCWDGMYKDKLMNTAVFVYKLDATLINGEQITKKGNISLIR